MSKDRQHKAMRLWIDIGDIGDSYLEDLDEEIASIAARVRKRYRKVKYGAIITAAASLSAAVAFVVLRPKTAAKFARKVTDRANRTTAFLGRALALGKAG